MKAAGNNIVQIGRDAVNVKITNINNPKKIEQKILPPEGTIGANPVLISKIQQMFNELGLRREQRFGKSAYPIMYSDFKKYFSIPRNKKYTDYLLWHESRAQEIIVYLQEKLDNTIQGRKEKAAKRNKTDLYRLLQETNKYHKMLGWNNEQYREHLKILFNVVSRADLSYDELCRYIDYLKYKIDHME